MKKLIPFLSIAALLLTASGAFSQNSIRSLNFNAASIRGFPTGEVFLTGGGSFGPGFQHLSGAFRVTQDINQGPLAGLRAGDGARWDAEEIIPSTGFKCTGAAEELLKTAVTDDNTIVIKADFYVQGDGNNASRHAIIFVSTQDEDDVLGGTQNVWIQGVGCGDANVNIR